MNRLLPLLTLLLVLLIFTGCQSRHAENRKGFANPGGMWMPHQLGEQAEILSSLGVDDPAALSDPLAHPLGAIVWLGGCSASFVSPDGLIVTNHHCASGSLQYHSTPQCNLFDEGFLARSCEEELPGEIGKKVWVTQAIEDVTNIIREGLAEIADPLKRHEEIESRIKALIAEHEKDNADIRYSVKEYFLGQQFYLIKQLEIKDIRLVYAPPESIGNFGGYVDNWQWPRHAGDFTFYRAYVGPDGKPAEYAEENIPYKPKHFLRVAAEPLNEHDLVMVAGYPGWTQRWRTAEQIEFDYEANSPRRIEVLTEVLAIYESLAAESEDLRIKVTPSIKGVTNSMQYLQFLQANIAENDLLTTKKSEQDALAAWVHADAERKQRWGDVLAEIAEINKVYQQSAYMEYLFECMTRYVPLVNAAHEIVRMAEERLKPDSERDPEFQERNWQRMKQAQRRKQKSYDPAIAKAVLAYYLGKIKEMPKEQWGDFQNPLPPSGYSPLAGGELVEGLFTDALTVDDPDVRVELFENASMEDLKTSDDPVMKFVLKLRPLTMAIEDKQDIYDGQMALLAPKYVAARKAFYGRPLAADANGTLRVTFGTVRGYRPSEDADVYEPFTTLTELAAKHTGDEPFNAPPRLLAAVKNAPTESPFTSEQVGDVPVNFLSDVDITGGNSGSATLNRNGEIVGLLFDGNSESMASDILFMPEITRGIHVDFRYVLWVMKYVDQAENLLDELGIDD